MSSRFIAVFSATPGTNRDLGAELEHLSPRIELYPPHGWILEVPPRYEAETLAGLSRLGERTLRIGGGSTRTVAVLAAWAAPGTLVPYGRETAFLADLPLEVLARCLEVEPRIWQVLREWGVTTLGELAALPERSLAARLGQVASTLLALARGEDVLFLPQYRPLPHFVAGRSLEWTVREHEPLLFLLSGLLESVLPRLQERGRAAGAVRLSFRLEGGRWWESRIPLATPTLDTRTLLSLIRLDLQTHPPEAGVTEIQLELEPSPPRARQDSLFEPRGPQPEKLLQTLARLRGVAGSGRLGVPQPEDSHRPDALILHPPETLLARSRPAAAPETATAREQRLTLRRIRPPRPIHLDREAIISTAGPWRSSGDWWKEAEPDTGGFWSREEWDIEFQDGLVARVYWDPQAGGWFLEGVYD
ncbi:MAG: hypothetical protein Kow00109_14210 [Acidobacteriota bacterium]